jgi:hypothetical protein
MSELINDRDWNMDDALHELTHVRQDMAGLLQLRPKMPKPQPWPSSSSPLHVSGSQKGKGKQTQSKGKGKQKGKPQWVTDTRNADGSTKPLCMRFQLGKCKLSDCKFSHLCSYPTPAGHACGGSHGAMEHKQVPH